MEKEISASEANAAATEANAEAIKEPVQNLEPQKEEGQKAEGLEVNDRLLEESKQWKKRAQEAERALKEREVKSLEEQAKYKELWEREKNEKKALAEKVLEDKKRSALISASSKHKCLDIDVALKVGNQALLQYDSEVDDFVGTDAFFEDLKASKAYLFDQSAKAPSVPRPGGVPREPSFDELSLDEREKLLKEKLRQQFSS